MGGDKSMFSTGRWIFIAALGFGCASTHAAYGPSGNGSGCGPGSQPLFYSPGLKSDWLFPPGFADSLWDELSGPVKELGYCPTPVANSKLLADTAGQGDNLYLQATAKDEGAGALSVSVIALRVREIARGKLPEAEARPLVYLRTSPLDAASLPSVLAKKVAENLRNQYVAVLLIRSNPPGAVARAASGLEGHTPLEWVVPLGSLPMTLTKPGYLKARRDLDLTSPGQHTYDLQLVKRRFYHSRLIYPTLAAGAVSAAAFILKNHYYEIYRELGPWDRDNRPEAFGQNFRTAKNYERLGYTTLGLAFFGLTLCLTF